MRIYSSLKNLKDKWKSLYLYVMQIRQMSNQIMASYDISLIMVSSIQVNLGRLELFLNAVPIVRASLNYNPLSGPDLTNQLIGILMTFRTEEVVLSIKLPDSQRRFLRYIWWSNNDLNGEHVDYEMCVHVMCLEAYPFQNVAIMHWEEQLLIMQQTMTKKLLRCYYILFT